MIPPAGGLARLTDALARKRVPLGFATAAIVLVLADPTWPAWRAGLIVSLLGETLRIWAAGHLEKGREVTRSGPYRWVRHPLYVGSSVVALGVVIAARSPVVAMVACLYMGSTLTAAIRTEEAFLRRTFGNAYDRYAVSRDLPAMGRSFSIERVMRNREYRGLAGLLGGFVLLALKVLLLL